MLLTPNITLIVPPSMTDCDFSSGRYSTASRGSPLGSHKSMLVDVVQEHRSMSGRDCSTSCRVQPTTYEPTISSFKSSALDISPLTTIKTCGDNIVVIPHSQYGGMMGVTEKSPKLFSHLTGNIPLIMPPIEASTSRLILAVDEEDSINDGILDEEEEDGSSDDEDDILNV